MRNSKYVQKVMGFPYPKYDPNVVANYTEEEALNVAHNDNEVLIYGSIAERDTDVIYGIINVGKYTWIEDC